jgi:hypothetical protein
LSFSRCSNSQKKGRSEGNPSLSSSLSFFLSFSLHCLLSLGSPTEKGKKKIRKKKKEKEEKQRKEKEKKKKKKRTLVFKSVVDFMSFYLTFLSRVLNRVFKAELLNIKIRCYNAQIKSHYFTKAPLRCPNTFKYFYPFNILMLLFCSIL